MNTDTESRITHSLGSLSPLAQGVEPTIQLHTRALRRSYEFRHIQAPYIGLLDGYALELHRDVVATTGITDAINPKRTFGYDRFTGIGNKSSIAQTLYKHPLNERLQILFTSQNPRDFSQTW